MASTPSVPALTCPACRRHAPPDSRFCPWCGTSLAGSTLQLPALGPVPAGTSERRLAIALGAVVAGLVAVLVLGALGLWWAEAVLVPATFLVAYAWWDPIVERFGEPMERFGRRSAVNVWSGARRARAAVGGWTREGRAQVRVRAKQAKVRRRHEEALHLLGKAVYSGDERRAARARALADDTGEQLAQFERELRLVHEEAERRLEEERKATDATAQFDPGELTRSATRGTDGSGG